jgi:4-hydroxy-3-methylbut-2-en-1-yl diphosphate synthase IspG/GcpE
MGKEIKFENVFNDEKREKVKEVIHQYKVLKGLSLVNPLHLQMTDNGHGEFPDGYKLTEKGIQYIIEQLNKQ